MTIRKPMGLTGIARAAYGGMAMARNCPNRHLAAEFVKYGRVAKNPALKVR